MLPGKRYTPDDLIRILWRYRWVIVAATVLCSAAGIGVALYLPNQYRSETLVLVVPQRVNETFLRSTVTEKAEDKLRSIREQILSRSNLEQIIKELNLYPEARTRLPMEIIVDRMRDRVTTNVVRENSFSVSFVANDPVLAQKVTARLTSTFTEANAKEREVQAERTNEFLATQLEDTRRRLAEREKALEEYRRKYAGELPEQVNTNLQAAQTAENQITNLLQGVNSDRDRRLLLERQLADITAPDAVVAPAASGLPPAPTTAQQLDAAEAALREMQTRLTPQHPDVTHARAEVQRLQGQLAAEREGETAAAAPISQAEMARRARISDLRAQLEALDRQINQKAAEEQRLRGVIASYHARLENAPTRETELAALTRDDDTLRTEYKGLLAKYEESTMAADMERRPIADQLRVLDPARVPERPFAPNRRLVSMAGAAGGVALGLVLVGLLEFRDRSLRSVADVTLMCALPVLATLPSMLTKTEQRRAKQRRRVVWALGTTASLVAIVAVAWQLNK